MPMSREDRQLLGNESPERHALTILLEYRDENGRQARDSDRLVASGPRSCKARDCFDFWTRCKDFSSARMLQVMSARA